MRIFRHYTELPAELRGGVVALGNFDGVHLGHQAVIAAARGLAHESGAPLGVMTFEPHPRALFNPDHPPFRLTPWRIKARQVEALGVKLLLIQHFDPAFASKTAAQFVDEVLVAGLGLRHVVVGWDYVFGKGRGGDITVLEAMALERGFGVTCLPPVTGAEGVVCSSTLIRERLAAGRPAEAATLLGRPWEIEGRVEPGDQRGRLLGFPTANIRLAEYLHPATGVYAVRAGVDHGGATVWSPGVANFGRRPTFDRHDLVLEVHLFDFAGDLYGQHLRVQLVEHLRAEAKFTGPDQLKAQIKTDCVEARRVLGALPSSVSTPLGRVQQREEP